MNDDALTAIIAQLQTLLTWQDGWNTYNAKAPNPTSISIATSWITTFYHHIASQNRQWITPHVGASGDGEVIFEWHNKHRKLCIYVDKDDIDFLQVWGKNIKAEMTDGDIESIDDMQQLWQWLLEADNESKDNSNDIGG